MILGRTPSSSALTSPTPPAYPARPASSTRRAMPSSMKRWRTAASTMVRPTPASTPGTTAEEEEAEEDHGDEDEATPSGRR
ncbi:hypothetical protein VTG60DRAFT_1411 [Thermothelomyces hinnuleus]